MPAAQYSLCDMFSALKLMIEEGNGFTSLFWTEKTGLRDSFLLEVYGENPYANVTVQILVCNCFKMMLLLMVQLWTVSTLVFSGKHIMANSRPSPPYGSSPTKSSNNYEQT